ncbi:MAG TPA: RNA methyltransferase [Thermomicrobiales bacterium]|jgi:TrmH family RNA methyltransferase|nr:RNA methyltransferase [Thermomicrobiales bacterium]
MPSGTWSRRHRHIRQVAMPLITSPDNATLRLARSLSRRKGRQAARLYLAEGERVVADIIAAGQQPRVILVREDYEPDRKDLRDLLSAEGIDLRIVATPLFDDVADTVSPQGIIGLFPLPEHPQLPPDADLVVLLDGIRDPGNLGTLIRSAAAAGATAIVTSPGTVDPYSPKVVRAAMGAHARLLIIAIDDRVEADLRRFPIRAVAEADAQWDHDAIDWRQPSVVIIGSEADGPTDVGLRVATRTVGIPMSGGVESLNAGVAGSIILFEVARQRRSGNGRAKADAESGAIR